MKDQHRKLLASLIAAVALGLATYMIDHLFRAYGIHPSTETIVDDLAIGFLAGLAVFLAASWRGERESRMQERLVLIAELNHHGRNALTAIVMSAELPETKERLGVIEDEVERIEWVLGELVPTAVHHTGAPRLLGRKP